ncbi:MAG: AMP-binding protein [Puia sp.]|nr:AMP-binding protein [Puia sp.]
MIVFERSYSSQSMSVTNLTLQPIVKDEIIKYFPSVLVVGIIARTDWPLIQAWQACLDAGRDPIILHYPTPKLSRVYWKNEINYAVESSGISLLICETRSCVPPDNQLPVILLDELTPVGCENGDYELPDQGTLIQMSSGTTGYRKGIRFNFRDIERHIHSFNKTLNLTPDDCVVSWLPLYHDMGFIAAFIMPRLLGCKIVMLDPVDWIRRPESLWEAIEEHGGTICYMPNFGFEVMSTNGRHCPGMRKWISCSEPTREKTMERFRKATSALDNSIVNCWGMAENIFAVSCSDGIRTRSINGIDVVSCGRPIPGVQVKEVDGEIYVRSDYSLKEYIGFPLSLDGEGFYGSGDLGVIEDGEIYLLGRKHDIINVAGRKALASDIDFLVAEEVPESAGRIASVSVLDGNLGTDYPLILIEHAQFWLKDRELALKQKIVGRIGIENARVQFIPPRFITKTSSGKINRKETKKNWLLLQDSISVSDNKDVSETSKARLELKALFPWVDFSVPIGEQIDSLGLVNVNIILTKYRLNGNIGIDGKLDAVFDAVSARIEGAVNVVLLGDANCFRPLAEPVLRDLVRDTPQVQVKHLCVPPLHVLFSDLIFLDYFMCRDHRGRDPYDSVAGVLSELKGADVIIIDEASAIFWPFHCPVVMTYPQISHDFQADSLCELIAVRWARYTEAHDKIACTCVSRDEMDVRDVNSLISGLQSYLRVPIIKVAYGNSNAAITECWDVQGSAEDVKDVAAFGNNMGVDIPGFRGGLLEALRSALAPVLEKFARENINWNDQPHWCSWPVNRAMVDFIFDHYKNCLVLGKASSVPYLAHSAAVRNVSIRFRPDLHVPDDCDCVIMAGPWGKPDTDKPIFQLMAAGFLGEPAINLPAELEGKCPPNRLLA